jgi:hypothetical protein
MRRNAINVTIRELVDLAYKLMNEVDEKREFGVEIDTVFSIPIIAPNDTEIKDLWRFEKRHK